MSKDITFLMMGGLGNILFSFANTFALSKKNNLTLKILYDHHGYLHTHPTFYKEKIFKNFQEIQNVNNFLKYEYWDFPFQEATIPKDNNIIVIGYFQSEKYFKEYEHELRSIILNDEKLISELKQKYIPSNKKTVSLHIRRGNYLQLSDLHKVLDLDYYKKSLQMFKNHKVFIFSDDIEYCKSNLILEDCVFVENKSDIEDLYLMSLCDNHIIANSTFSWWGAWLNGKENKIVIAPNDWFGINNTHIDTKDLLPKSWIKL